MVKRAASTSSTSKVPRKVKKESSKPIDEMFATISKNISSDIDLPEITDPGNEDVKPIVKKAKKEMIGSSSKDGKDAISGVHTESSSSSKTEMIVENVNGVKTIKVVEEVMDAKIEKIAGNVQEVKKVKAVRTRKVDGDVKAQKAAGKDLEFKTAKTLMKERASGLQSSWPTYLKQEHETTGKSVLSAVGSSQKFLGAHVSINGGVENAVYNAMAIGCRSFALFLKNQKTWNSKPLEDGAVQRWHRAIKETGFDLKMIVPHASYLPNAGSPNAELREKSKNSLLDDIRRCEKLGITLYNFHPGSSCGKCTAKESIGYIAEVLDEIIENTSDVILLIETMAGQGNTIGGKFEELKSIIDKVKEENRHRVGVCLDTCHIFAAGYDIRSAKTYEQTMAKFDKVIGLDKLKAVHVNDSKADLGSNLDRHENIGEGKLKKCWQFFMNDPRLDNIPLILETPDGQYPREMIELYGMDKMNSESDD